MLETTFNTVIHSGVYVDMNLLNKGIYASDKPFIYDRTTTIDSLIERGKLMIDMGGNNFISEEYFNNLKLCKVVPVSIIIEI